MNGQIYSISLEQMDKLLRQLRLSDNDHQVMMDAGKITLHLYAGIYDHILLCLLGVIPETVLSDKAYLWCYHTPEVSTHKVAFGRHAIKFIRDLRLRYSYIHGHCLNDASRRWLHSLGAQMISPSTFEIVNG